MTVHLLPAVVAILLGLAVTGAVDVTTSSGNMTPPVEVQNRVREMIEDGNAPPEVAEHMSHTVFLAEKDLRLALELAGKLGVDLPNTANVRERVEHTFGAGRPGPRRSE